MFCRRLCFQIWDYPWSRLRSANVFDFAVDGLKQLSWTISLTTPWDSIRQEMEISAVCISSISSFRMGVPPILPNHSWGVSNIAEPMFADVMAASGCSIGRRTVWRKTGVSKDVLLNEKRPFTYIKTRYGRTRGILNALERRATYMNGDLKRRKNMVDSP